MLVSFETSKLAQSNSLMLKQNLYEVFFLFLPLLHLKTNFLIKIFIIQKGTCTPIFIVVLFTTAKKWKQSKCILIDEWIKVFFIHMHVFSVTSVMSDHVQLFETPWTVAYQVLCP